jgi:Putative phage metallopeptidase
MSAEYSPAESVQAIAQSLLPTYHPELGTARISYLFIDRVPKKGGRELYGKAVKVSGRWESLTELDFIVEVSLPKWNDLTEDQRTALVDHLLERCSGEEDEETGEYLWSLRDPDVQEFSTILKRHGIWHEGLTSFVQVAHGLDIASIVEEETGEDVAAVQGESVELDLNEEDS